MEDRRYANVESRYSEYVFFVFVRFRRKATVQYEGFLDARAVSRMPSYSLFSAHSAQRPGHYQVSSS